MDDIKNLFNKVKSDIEAHTITSIEISFSIYQKRLVVVINGEPHIISDLISDDVWNIGGKFKSPEDDWKIRTLLSNATRQYLLKIDPRIDTSKIIF